jgi:hypothetical protein
VTLRAAVPRKEDRPEVLQIVHELRIVVANYVLDGNPGIDVPRVDVLERLLLREAL